MNRLIKQLFTPNTPVAQLSEHKTEELRRTCWPGCRSKEFCKNYCLNFHKMNRYHYLLEPVVIIPLFPNVWFCGCDHFSHNIAENSFYKIGTNVILLVKWLRQTGRAFCPELWFATLKQLSCNEGRKQVALFHIDSFVCA